MADDFPELDDEAEQLRQTIAALRDEFVGFRKDVAAVGQTGVQAFQEQTEQVGILNSSVNSISGALARQFTAYKLVRTAMRDVRKGLDDLVEGAIEFGKARDSAFDPNNFDSLVKRFQERLKNVLGVGGTSLFKEIKGLFSDLGDVLGNQSPIGTAFAAGVQAVDDGLAEAVHQARLLIQTIDPGSLLNVARAIGESVSAIATVLRPVVAGLVNGLGDLAQIARALAQTLGNKLFGDDLGLNLEILTRISVVVLGLVVPTAAILSSFTGFAIPLFFAASAIALMSGGLGVAKDETDGINLKFGSIRDILANDIVFFIEKLSKGIELLGQALDVFPSISRAMREPTLENLRAIETTISKTATLADQYKALEKAQTDANDQTVAGNEKAESGAQALATAYETVKNKILETIGTIPALQLHTQEAAQNGIDNAFQQISTQSFGNGGTGVNPGIGDAITADITKSFNTLTPAVQSFGNIISETIADALDPSRNKVPIKKRFEDFLKSLPMILLRGFAGGGASGGSVGFADGGLVGRGGIASLAHYIMPRGFAHGGAPAGLDPSDRVPIWAGVGEWVIRARSAAMYGRDVMAALNAGAIDPAALRFVAHGQHAPVPTPSRGFATGGLVTAGAGAAAPQTNVLPILPVDRRTAELIFAQDSVFLDALAKNSNAARSVLGIR